MERPDETKTLESSGIADRHQRSRFEGVARGVRDFWSVTVVCDRRTSRTESGPLPLAEGAVGCARNAHWPAQAESASLFRAVGSASVVLDTRGPERQILLRVLLADSVLGPGSHGPASWICARAPG
jgi:hypothetical protein